MKFYEIKSYRSEYQRRRAFIIIIKKVGRKSVQVTVPIMLSYYKSVKETRRKKKVTRIDVYETLCPQQMLVHKGGKIKNWGGECNVTPTKSLSKNIRVDVNREVKFL